MRRRLVWFVCVCALAGAPTATANAEKNFQLRVLSSPPSMVTGGDALVEVTIPKNVPPAKATVLVNGADVTATLELDRKARTLTGMVTGLRLGPNTLAAESNASGARGRPEAELTLVNHPVTGPIFSGPQQYPFLCRTETARPGPAHCGQPGRAGHAGLRNPEAPGTTVVGWSRDCAAATVVDYLYRATNSTFKPLPAAAAPGRPGRDDH